MTPELQIVLSGLIVASGAAFGAWLSFRLNRKKIQADTAAIIEETSGNLISRIEKRVAALEIELAGTRKTLDDKECIIHNLEGRIAVLERIILTKDASISNLVAENVTKDTKIAALETRVAELETELEKLKAKGRKSHGTT